MSGNWVNTNMDTDGNSQIGTEVLQGKSASLGDRDSKRVVCDYQYPNKIGLTAGSKATKEEKQGQ
ncbi:MAG: hypothetical protein KGL39_08740 [Patescibacteria group bacterium]|nr:hypothetical protein [Patescibacteria group bacterium]